MGTLLAALLHLLLLCVPLLFAGTTKPFRSPAFPLFLVLATLFLLADRGGAGLDRVRPGRREIGALLTGILMLLTFWVAVAQQAAGAAFAWWPAHVLGVALMLAGVGLRYGAVRALGDAFVTPAVVEPGAELIRRGVYAWLRHPSETGNLALCVGAALLLGSPIALALAILVLLPVVVTRIRREERFLAHTFGAAWRDYCTHVKRLVPGVY